MAAFCGSRLLRMSKRPHFAPLLKPPKRDPFRQTLRRLASIVRTEHHRDLGPTERSWKRLIERGARGAALGAVMGALALLVGLGRCALYTLAGREIAPLTGRDY